MNLKRKFLLGTLSAGLLISPLSYIHNQANASEKVEQSAQINEVGPFALLYSIKGSEIKKEGSKKTVNFIGREHTVKVNSKELESLILQNEKEINPDTTYEFDGFFKGNTEEDLEITKSHYIGNY